MQRWFSFSTDIVKKDKRKRKAVALVAYFEKLEETWAGILGERDIHFCMIEWLMLLLGLLK